MLRLAGVGGWKAPPSPTQLEKVVKLETFAGQTSEYIGQTWLKFHEDETKGRVGWTLTRSQYKQLKRNANECPLFIIPLEKPEGYVTLVVQWQSQLALFTTLDEFRASASNADSHLTLTHYTELAAKKGLVLVRGDTSTPKLINAFEARMLVKRLYDYYLDPQKYSRWVKTFNHASKQFDYNSYIKELGFLA